MKVSTVREDVLEAFQALERKTGRLDFRPQEIVEEVLRRSPERKAASVRTHVTSVMCADAPVHHDNHTDELSRVAPGIYRRNRNVGQVDSAPPTVERAAAVVSEYEWPWPWEGVVVDVYATALEEQGWEIISRTDTASRQQGIDLVASRGAVTRYVEAKGFPSTVYQTGPRRGQPKPTNPATQARVWFSGALLSTMLLQSAYPEGEVVMMFPDYPTYRSLGLRLIDGLDRLGILIHLVSEDGSIEELRPQP